MTYYCSESLEIFSADELAMSLTTLLHENGEVNHVKRGIYVVYLSLWAS